MSISSPRFFSLTSSTLSLRICRVFSPWKVSSSNADLSRWMLFILESGWLFHVSKDSLELIHMHKRSWTHGIASLQAEPCLSALVKGDEMTSKCIWSLFRSRGEQPLMILSQMNLLTNAGPFWLTHVPDELSVPAAYSDVMPEYYRWKLKQSQPTQPLKPLIFLRFDFYSLFHQPKFEKAM